MDPISKFVVDYVVDPASYLILPIILLCFLGGVAVRVLIYYVAWTEDTFAREFEKRVHQYFMNLDAPRVSSFHRLTRILLSKTYHECFELKNKYKRRKLDHISSLTERLFLIQEGVYRLIQDTLRQTRWLKRDGMSPRMTEISKSSFESNAVFNRLIGVFPIGRLNDILGILPGLFIIGGIFGTFLGISRSLPDLGMIDLNDATGSKQIMDAFLIKISQAMVKSIIGIGLSVVMSVVNTIFSVEGMFYTTVNRYSSALEHLWNETTTNEHDLGESATLDAGRDKAEAKDASKQEIKPPPAPTDPKSDRRAA